MLFAVLPIVCILLGIWILIRYSCWLISRTLSLFLRCTVNVGGFCYFGVVNVRVQHPAGALHIDSITVGLFPQQFSKPLVLRVGDVRIERDLPTFANKQDTVDGATSPKTQPSNSPGRLVTVVAQYIAICVTSVHVVLLESLPGCMVHLTIDEMDVETFRSREGWQLEMGCRLAQGKALRRKQSSNSSPSLPILEFGLQTTISADVAGGNLNKISLKINDPIVSVSQGIFDFFADHSQLKEKEANGSTVDRTEDKEIKSRIGSIMEKLMDLSFQVDNSTIRYLAEVNDGSRALSLSVRTVTLKRDGQIADARILGLSLSDQAGKSVLRSAMLQMNTSETSLNVVDTRLSSDSVHTALRISDVLWWREHFITVLRHTRPQSPVTQPQPSPYSTPPQPPHSLTLSVSLEVESLVCDVTDTDAFKSTLSVNFLSFSKSASEMEFGVDSLTVTSITLPEGVQPTFDVHHWGQMVYVGVALVQISSADNCYSIRLAIDDCKLEWSDRLAEQIERIVKAIGPTPEKRRKRKIEVEVKARAKRVALFVSALSHSFLVYSTDELAFESSSFPSDFAISARSSRLGIGEISTSPFLLSVLKSAGKYVARRDDDSCREWRCWNQTQKDASKTERRKHAEEVYRKKGIELWGLADTISLSLASPPPSTLSSIRDVIVSSHGEVYLCWSPLLHRIIYHIVQVSKKCLRPPSSSTISPSSPSSSLVLKVITKYPVVLDLALPRHHRMVWRVPSLVLEKRTDYLSISSPELTITCNGQRILTATNVNICKKSNDEQMEVLRRQFGELLADKNKVWTWSADLFHFLLPFEFNFAEVFSEFINCFKWIKIVHQIEKKEFTRESPLPSDIRILFKEARLEMEDDPFESSLQSNYELMEDEVYECERRRQMLTEKLGNLKKGNPLLPQTKIDELFASLQEKNSAIYIERWRKQPPQKRPLFVSSWQDLKIRAFADLTLHGTERCVELIQEFDPVSHYPSEGINFSTLWARGCEFDVQNWTIQFRDYPIPYFQATDMHFFGTLVGAEEMDSGRSLRSVTIPLPNPWETHTVERNMAPLKYYYDMQCECDRLLTWYGPCWEPCLSMVSLSWNNISAPSLDPSPSLPFWDKMRYLLHGRYSMLCKTVTTTMLASPDPYNSTETVEWCWDEFGLDWLIGEIRIRSGVGVYMRTASKYDDSRILLLPEVRWRIMLDWVCLGDPHDHHSAIPCAPNRLPHCATGQDHDSYRAFRSKCLDLSFFFDVDGKKTKEGDLSSTNRPHVLLYANTFRCIEFLMNTLTMTNRPVKKGKLFGSPTRHKQQLSKHFRDVKIVVNFPFFYITYWMSHSSDYGFRVTSDGLSLSAFMRLSASPAATEDNVKRRQAYVWSPQQVTAALGKTQVHVFGEGRSPTEDGSESEETLLMGLQQLQYIREQRMNKETALHRLILTDLKASWTSSNRDACLMIADGVHRAHLLRSILSNDAIKILKLKTDSLRRAAEVTAKGGESMGRVESGGRERGWTSEQQEDSLLDKLIDESSTKLVAHCEQATELPTDSLLGVSQCSADDVVMINWQVDLLNSQLVLKGCEKDGFLLVTAARTSLTQKIHRCVWKNSQLLGKKSWSAVLSGMQYFAPVSITEGVLNKARFKWLKKEEIEEKGHDQSSDTLAHFISNGGAVGGVVQEDSGGHTDAFPLQRIVSRCSCEIYFCYYSENLKSDALEETGLPAADFDTNSLDDDSAVDCLTLKHNMLEASSNSAQYEMVVDIVNNLVLFVDPKKKEVAEHRRRLRFECQLLNMQQMRESIIEQQTELREIVSIVRSLERQIYYLDTQAERDERKRKDLLSEMEEYKTQQLDVSDQLAIFISCYKQRQVEQLRAAAVSARIEADQQAPVARRFEVCFEDCIWKLTESDGQIGMSQLQIRNFLYTRVMRIDNSGDHCFEVGSIRVINLLPNTQYKDTLHRDERVAHLQPAIRVILRDMPPVAGICVKEHFEVNIIPMVAQITYRFFDKMMEFFFPGQNIHKDENLDTNDDGSQKLSLTRRLANIRSSRGGAQFERKQSTLSGKGNTGGSRNSEVLDDIDKMRARADRNNLFVYIKIPEVPFVVSYKGNKEKNILDVDRFNFVFPLCEYHERNWTWLDVSLAVKQRCRRVLLQQFMKQKLLRNRLVGNHDSFEGITEEEKKRIALGTTSTMEKKKKK